MISKNEILYQIQTTLSRNRIYMKKTEANTLTSQGEIHAFVEQIPKHNLLSTHSWFLIILRNKTKTLILETVGLLGDEARKKIVTFVLGKETDKTKEVHNYDKNRCVVNYAQQIRGEL